LDFDPLDVTKTWPEDKFPLMNVGIMTLSQNIDNFFHENEQLAFSPSLVVPGIYYSDDKLLQARLFSYPDTQRYRLGGNYLMLPVNAPRCSFHNNHIDGVMNFMKRVSAINYFPSDIEGASNYPFYFTRNDTLQGLATRSVIDKQNNFAQAGKRYSLFDPERRLRFQQRIIDAFAEENLIPFVIKQTWIQYWNATHPEIGNALATGVTYTNFDNPGALTTGELPPVTTSVISGFESSMVESSSGMVDLSGGAIAAIVVGSVAFAFLLAFLIFILTRNLRQYS